MSNLTNEEITDIWEAMPGQPGGWLKEFGYIQFARAIEKETASRCRVNGGITGLEGLTRYGWTEDTSIGVFDIRARADGTYVKFADVERLLAARAAAEKPTGDLTDEQIRDAVQGIYLSDFQDNPEGYDIAIARAAIAAHLAAQKKADSSEA
jgi:hypothetical protein